MKMTKNSVSGLLAGGVICLTACISIGSKDVEKVMQERPVVSSMIVSPEIPSAVPFCGKIIDITRYNMREGFDREISTFSYLHATTMLYFKRANRYFPIIEPILKANGIPDDFKYLAVIESNLDTRIKSPAGAVGMWQLMPATAREYGLVITPTVDERCDVEKATAAACRYLKAAYDKYNDWAAVASSYNAGMGRISGELNKQDADNTFDLWLVEETSRYMFRILAAKMFFEDPTSFGFYVREKDKYPVEPKPKETVSVSGPIENLVDFAEEHGIRYATLKGANLWLRDSKLTNKAGKTYEIVIPREDR